MYNYDISFPQTDPLNSVPLERLRDTSSLSTIAPHWSSSYPHYLSPDWDENTQRAVVWNRLQEHHKLANRSLQKINERYKALRQEQQTQVESHHESSSCDTTLCHIFPHGIYCLCFFSFCIRQPNWLIDNLMRVRVFRSKGTNSCIRIIVIRIIVSMARSSKAER